MTVKETEWLRFCFSVYRHPYQFTTDSIRAGAPSHCPAPRSATVLPSPRAGLQLHSFPLPATCFSFPPFQIALELKAPGLYIGFFPPSLWAHFKTKIMHIFFRVSKSRTWINKWTLLELRFQLHRQNSKNKSCANMDLVKPGSARP